MVNMEQIRKNAKAIFDIAYRPGTLPRKIMEADQSNASHEWREETDARNFDKDLNTNLDTLDKAIEVLSKK